MRRQLLAGTAAAVALLCCSPAAEAEQAKAGPFVQEGMDGMMAVALALPPDGDARGSIRSCDVRARRAICRLRVAVHGYQPCTVTMVLTRGLFAFPSKGWACPSSWRPDPKAERPDADALSLRKALR